MQQNDEQVKITLTQWTHANVVKLIFDLWRVPLERHILSTVYSLQPRLSRQTRSFHRGDDNMESLRMTNMWQDLVEHGITPEEKGSLVMNCENELAELMRQIDVMVAQKKDTWDQHSAALANQIATRDQELLTQKAVMQQKVVEIRQLKLQSESQDNKQKEIVREYQCQLANVKAQVSGMKQEYEKLQKRYSKHARTGTGSKKNDVEKEVEKLKEINAKNVNELESLRSQHKTLLEKYQFIEQQSTTYQSQLDRRKELMNDTESTLRSKVNDLQKTNYENESNIRTQESHINRLKDSIEESLNAHRSILTEKDIIQKELKKTNKLYVQATEELSQCRLQKESLSSQLKSKDVMSTKHETERMTLKQTITDQRAHIKALQKTELQLKEEINDVRSKLTTSTDRCSRLNDELTTLIEDRLKGAQTDEKLQSLESEVGDLQTRLQQEQAMKDKTSHTNMEIQKQLLDLQHTLHRRNAEVTVVNSQLEALRVENRHLRQTALQGKSDRDLKLAESQLHDLQNAYATSIQALEKQNSNLQNDILSLNERLKQVERDSEERLMKTLREKEISLKESHEKKEKRLLELNRLESERVSSVQRELDTSVALSEQQHSELCQQIENLKTQVHEKSLSLQRIVMEHNALSSFVSGVNNVVYNPPKQYISPKYSNQSPPRQDLSHISHGSANMSNSFETPHTSSAFTYHTHHEFILPASQMRRLHSDGSQSSPSYSPTSAHTSVSMSECDHQHLPLASNEDKSSHTRGEQSLLTHSELLPSSSTFEDRTHLSLLAVEDDEILDSIDARTARFREDQEKRTQELQEKFERHIESLRVKSDATVHRYE